ncbi:MAG: hypothetical protein HOE25_04065 [Flavobacteriales bacterium]|mgnify:FL=1|nr:hypothetical protein [Flavobacteriales bacterium]MBT6354024.1 hypothetical protein [Pelagibacteraceae bacterium]
MFKLLLVALISLIVPFKFVYADVLTSIKDSWDSAKNVLIELSEEEEIKTDLPQERALAIWDDLKDNFEEIAELKLNKESAPNESFFGKTKRDYDEKIETIFQILSKITNDPQIVKDRSSLEKLKLKIAKSKQKSSDLKTKALLSTGKDKEKLIDKSNSHLSDIDEYQNSYNEVLSNVQRRLQSYNLPLDFDQVKVLLSRVDSDDIIGMTTSFSVIAELTKQFSEATLESGEDLQIAKNYYFMHVILLELQMHIQANYIDKLENEYLVKLGNLKRENGTLIAETKSMVNSSEGSHKKVYEQNLNSQQYTRKVLDLYDDILKIDLKKIKNGRNKVYDNFLIALNTYETVNISSDLAVLMEDNKNLFNEVMKLQTPEMITFENLQMQDAFQALTLQLSDNE